MNRTLIAFAFLLSCSLPVQAAPILPGGRPAAVIGCASSPSDDAPPMMAAGGRRRR